MIESAGIVVAGGVLGDPTFLLEKYEDDGGLSVWGAGPSDGSLAAQVTAAATAWPLPNRKIRVANVRDLVALDWQLRHTPALGAYDPDRHYDAVYRGGSKVDLELIKTFISTFGDPIPNPGRTTRQ